MNTLCIEQTTHNNHPSSGTAIHHRKRKNTSQAECAFQYRQAIRNLKGAASQNGTALMLLISFPADFTTDTRTKIMIWVDKTATMAYVYVDVCLFRQPPPAAGPEHGSGHVFRPFRSPRRARHSGLAPESDGKTGIRNVKRQKNYSCRLYLSYDNRARNR